MSGIYIPGMEMPKGEAPLKAFIYSDGRVRVKLQGGGYLGLDAIPVPPHGRLIDRDALIRNHAIDKYDCSEVISVEDIRNAPTIIPDSKEGET